MDPDQAEDPPASAESKVRTVQWIHSPGQDDRLDLRELALALWSGRWLIAGLSFVLVLFAVAYVFLATPIYRVEVVLAPNESSQAANLPAGLGGLGSLVGIDLGASAELTEAVAILRSRAFAEEFLVERRLLPVLFYEDWDSENERWIEGEEPTLWDGVEFFIDDVRSISEDSSTGLVTLAIEWRDPELAVDWVGGLVYEINERLRVRDMANSQRRLDYLNAQLEQASLVELRQAISRLIETEIQTVMLAQAEEEYAFKVIDPPRVPTEHTRPNRPLIVILAALFGLVIGSFVTLMFREPGRHGKND